MARTRSYDTDPQKRPPMKVSTKNLTVHEKLGDDYPLIFTVPNFLTHEECQMFIKYADSLNFTPAQKGMPARGEAFRDNDRVLVEDESIATLLWNSGLSTLLLQSMNIRIAGKHAVGLSPAIRFYRYNVGQKFETHIDESQADSQGRKTEYTLLVYLTGADDGLQGGETVFYRGGKGNRIFFEATPQSGLMLCHGHGQRCMPHEAREVKRGVKYVLRTDLIFDR